MEFSKSDKKTIRALIHKGMMLEFERGMKKAETIINDWKKGEGNPQEAYHKLFGHLMTFDKGIAHRYDGLSNSNLIFVLTWQIQKGFVDRNELTTLSDEGKEKMERMLS